MSDTVTVIHPDYDGSTITVTSKAYAAVYAAEGYVLSGKSVAPGVSALEAENQRLREQLAGRTTDTTATDRADQRAALDRPARAPRKRAPRKAAAAPVAPAPGPADIGSTGELDTI